MAALPYSSRLTGGGAGGHCLQDLKVERGGWLRYRIAHISLGGGAGGHCLQDLKVERGNGCATV